MGIEGIFETSNPADLLFLSLSDVEEEKQRSLASEKQCWAQTVGFTFLEKRTLVRKTAFNLHLWDCTRYETFPHAREER